MGIVGAIASGVEPAEEEVGVGLVVELELGLWVEVGCCLGAIVSRRWWGWRWEWRWNGAGTMGSVGTGMGI